jgi:hypothetical protein
MVLSADQYNSGSSCLGVLANDELVVAADRCSGAWLNSTFWPPSYPGLAFEEKDANCGFMNNDHFTLLFNNIVINYYNFPRCYYCQSD